MSTGTKNGVYFNLVMTVFFLIEFIVVSDRRIQ